MTRNNYLLEETLKYKFLSNCSILLSLDLKGVLKTGVNMDSYPYEIVILIGFSQLFLITWEKCQKNASRTCRKFNITYPDLVMMKNSKF